jgi:hypothetical protein
LAIKQKLKYRYGIIFTYFWPHLRPNNDNFQKLAVVATVTKFAQKKKNKQTNKRSQNGGGKRKRPKVDPAPCSVNTTQILTLGLLHKWGSQGIHISLKKTQFR